MTELNETSKDQDQKESTTFDIPTYAQKARQALERLKKEQRPGEQVGLGGKMDVLSAVKPEIEKLFEEGYTAKQISEILRQDVFKVLPKSITQILGAKSKARKTRKPRNKNVQSSDTAPLDAVAPLSVSETVDNQQLKQSKEKSSTINVKPDKLFT